MSETIGRHTYYIATADLVAVVYPNENTMAWYSQTVGQVKVYQTPEGKMFLVGIDYDEDGAIKPISKKDAKWLIRNAPVIDYKGEGLTAFARDKYSRVKTLNEFQRLGLKTFGLTAV